MIWAYAVCKWPLNNHHDGRNSLRTLGHLDSINSFSESFDWSCTLTIAGFEETWRPAIVSTCTQRWRREKEEPIVTSQSWHNKSFASSDGLCSCPSPELPVSIRTSWFPKPYVNSCYYWHAKLCSLPLSYLAPSLFGGISYHALYPLPHQFGRDTAK